MQVAVQDRTARGGLKARREHRRSGLRCAHHFAPSLREPPRLTRLGAVLQRRHCQQAACDDAGRFACIGVVPSRHRAEALSAIDVAGHATPRNADGSGRFAQMRGSFRRRSRDARRAKGCAHPGIVKIADRRQAPRRDLLRSIELQRRVTTATPFGARDGHEGKEPWKRFELTA